MIWCSMQPRLSLGFLDRRRFPHKNVHQRRHVRFDYCPPRTRAHPVRHSVQQTANHVQEWRQSWIPRGHRWRHGFVRFYSKTLEQDRPLVGIYSVAGIRFEFLDETGPREGLSRNNFNCLHVNWVEIRWCFCPSLTSWIAGATECSVENTNKRSGPTHGTCWRQYFGS